MNRLFFIHTPFQLSVAQQIIRQNEWLDNYMVYGYVYDNVHFLDIYDLLLIPSFWKDRFFYAGVAGWSKVYVKRPVKTICNSIKGFRRIMAIIKRCNIECVCFGDISNPCYQLLNIFLNKKGIKTIYFEEGNSHYLNIPRSVYHGNVIKSLISSFYDLTLFIPLMHFRFASHILYDAIDYDTLPIFERYSIIPYYDKSFDRLVKMPLYIPEKVRDYILSDFSVDKIPNDLFMSEPVFSGSKDVECLIKKLSIIEYFHDKSIDSIAIKFHPRETVEDKNAVLEAFSYLKIKTIVISRTINLPVEYFLCFCHFNSVYTFCASTVYYNGFLYDKLKCYTLIKIYNRVWIEHYGDTAPADVKFALSDSSFLRLFENGTEY